MPKATAKAKATASNVVHVHVGHTPKHHTHHHHHAPRPTAPARSGVYQPPPIIIQTGGGGFQQAPAPITITNNLTPSESSKPESLGRELLNSAVGGVSAGAVAGGINALTSSNTPAPAPAPIQSPFPVPPTPIQNPFHAPEPAVAIAREAPQFTNDEPPRQVAAPPEQPSQVERRSMPANTFTPPAQAPSNPLSSWANEDPLPSTPQREVVSRESEMTYEPPPFVPAPPPSRLTEPQPSPQPPPLHDLIDLGPSVQPSSSPPVPPAKLPSPQPSPQPSPLPHVAEIEMTSKPMDIQDNPLFSPKSTPRIPPFNPDGTPPSTPRIPPFNLDGAPPSTPRIPPFNLDGTPPASGLMQGGGGYPAEVAHDGQWKPLSPIRGRLESDRVGTRRGRSNSMPPMENLAAEDIPTYYEALAANDVSTPGQLAGNRARSRSVPAIARLTRPFTKQTRLKY